MCMGDIQVQGTCPMGNHTVCLEGVLRMCLLVALCASPSARLSMSSLMYAGGAQERIVICAG